VGGPPPCRHSSPNKVPMARLRERSLPQVRGRAGRSSERQLVFTATAPDARRSKRSSGCGFGVQTIAVLRSCAPASSQLAGGHGVRGVRVGRVDTSSRTPRHVHTVTRRHKRSRRATFSIAWHSRVFVATSAGERRRPLNPGRDQSGTSPPPRIEKALGTGAVNAPLSQRRAARPSPAQLGSST